MKMTNKEKLIEKIYDNAHEDQIFFDLLGLNLDAYVWKELNNKTIKELKTILSEAKELSK